MKSFRKLQWLADFELEPLLSALLLGGLLLSIGCLIAGLLWHWRLAHHLELDALHGTNVFHFIVEDLRQAHVRTAQPRLLIDLGIAVLLFCPYLRVASCLLYFAFVERHRTYTLLTACVFATLSYIVFLG